MVETVVVTEIVFTYELNTIETRLHSSRMRTARLLTVSQHALCGGVSAREVSAGGGDGMADPLL